MSFPSPPLSDSTYKHTSNEALEVEAMQLEAAQLSKQGQVAAKLLQNVYAVL